MCMYIYYLEFGNSGLQLFQSWDLVQQTQNYLKLLLHIINSDGKLLHFLTHLHQPVEHISIVCVVLDNFLDCCGLQMITVYWCTVYQAGTGHLSLYLCSDFLCGRQVLIPLSLITYVLILYLYSLHLAKYPNFFSLPLSFLYLFFVLTSFWIFIGWCHSCQSGAVRDPLPDYRIWLVSFWVSLIPVSLMSRNVPI